MDYAIIAIRVFAADWLCRFPLLGCPTDARQGRTLEVLPIHTKLWISVYRTWLSFTFLGRWRHLSRGMSA